MEDVEYLEEYEELILSPHRNFEDNIIEEITDGYVLGMEQPSFMEDIGAIEGTIPFRDFLNDSVTEPLPSADRYNEMQAANPKEVCNDFQNNSNIQNYDANEDGNVAYFNTQFDETPSTIENAGITKKKRKKRRIKNLDAPSSEDELHDANSKKGGAFLSGAPKNQPQIKGILVGGPSIKETGPKNISPAKNNANELNDAEEEERELPFKIFKNKATGEVVKKGQVRFIRKSDLADNSSKETEKRTDYSSIIDKLKKKSADPGINRKVENVPTQNNSKKESPPITELKKKPKPKIVPLKSEPTDVERRLWSLKNDVPTRRKSQEFERDKIKIQPQRRKSQYFLPSEFTTTIDDRKKLQEKSKLVIPRRKSQYTSPAELALEERQKRLLEKEKITAYFKNKSQASLLAEKKKAIMNSSRPRYNESPTLSYESCTKENSGNSQSKHGLSSNQQKISTKRPYTEVSLNEVGRKEEPGPSKRKRPQIAVKNDGDKHESTDIATQRSSSEILKQHIKSELTKNIAKSASQLAKLKDILSQSYSDSEKSSSEKKIIKLPSFPVSSKEKPMAQNSSTKPEINKEKPKAIRAENKSIKSDDTKDKKSKNDSKKAESIGDSKKAESNGGPKKVEPIADSKKVDSIANSKKVESIADSKKVESIADSKKIESIANSKKVDSIEDSKKMESIGDSKKIESKELPNPEPKETVPELNVQQATVHKKEQESPKTPIENLRRKPGRPKKLKTSRIKGNPVVKSITKSKKSDRILKTTQLRVLSVRINRRFVKRYLEANGNRKKTMKNTPSNSPSDSVKKSKLEACSPQTRSDPALSDTPTKRILRNKKDKADNDVAETVFIAEVYKLPESPIKEDSSKENTGKAMDKVEQIKNASSKLDNKLKNQAENPDLGSKLEQRPRRKSTTAKPTTTKPTTTKSTPTKPTTPKPATTTRSTKRKSTIDYNENLRSYGGANSKSTKAYPGKVKSTSSTEITKPEKDSLYNSSDHLYKSIMDLLHIPQYLIVETRLLTTEEFKQKTSLHSIARAQARLAQHRLQVGNDTTSQNIASAIHSNLKKLLPENEGSSNIEGEKSNASPQAAGSAGSLTKSPKTLESINLGRNVSAKFFLDRVEDMINDYVTKEVKRELQEITRSYSITIQNLSFKRRLLRRNRTDDSKYDPLAVKFMYDYLHEMFSTAPNNKHTPVPEPGNVQKSGILYIDRTKASTSSDVRTTTSDVQGIQNDRSHFGGRFADTSHVTNTSSAATNNLSIGNYDTVTTFGDVQITSKPQQPSPEFHFRKIVLPTKNQAGDQSSQVKITKIGKKTTRNVKPNTRTAKKVLQAKQQSKPKVHTTIAQPSMTRSQFVSGTYPNITFRPLRSDSKSPEIITPDAYIPPGSDSEEEETNNTNPSSVSIEHPGIVMEDVHNTKMRLPASSLQSSLPSIDSASAGGMSKDVNASQKPDYHVVVTRTFKKILLPMDPISASDVSPENAVLPIIAHNLNSDSLNPSSSRDTNRDPLIGNVTEKDIDSADTFYTEDYSLDTGYQFKCDKCTIILSSRPLIQEHVQRAHFRFMNNCYLCKAHLDQSDQLQHFLNNHSTASISK